MKGIHFKYGNDPTDRDAFMARWTKILGDDTLTKKTILFDGHVVSNIVSEEVEKLILKLGANE